MHGAKLLPLTTSLLDWWVDLLKPRLYTARLSDGWGVVHAGHYGRRRTSSALDTNGRSCVYRPVPHGQSLTSPVSQLQRHADSLACSTRTTQAMLLVSAVAGGDVRHVERPMSTAVHSDGTAFAPTRSILHGSTLRRSSELRSRSQPALNLPSIGP